MNVTTPHSPRECRPDDPGLNFQLTPQISPHLPTDSVGPLDPGQKGMLKQTDQVPTIRESNPGRAATILNKLQPLAIAKLGNSYKITINEVLMQVHSIILFNI